MNLQLTWQENDNEQRYEVRRELVDAVPLVIGRSSRCHVRLVDPAVSRQHAELYWENGEFNLRNVSKTNSLKINGNVLRSGQSSVIRVDDQIQLGHSTIRIDVPSPESDTDLTRRDKVHKQPNDLVGQRLGKYTVVEKIGQGGMAEVFKARQPEINRFVAIKVMHGHLATSSDFVTRFRREAQALGRLQHPNILRVFDFDTQGDRHFMVMDHITGPTLHSYLQEWGDMPVPEALEIVDQLADALSYAHEHNMVHRDVKPENVMFTSENTINVVLADFGLVRLKDNSMTRTGSRVGTPAYMSPEVCRGERADHRADVYSLGVLLYQLLTGRLPHWADSPLDLAQKKLNEPPVPPSKFNANISARLERVILKALATDIEDRYQSIAEFQADLTALNQDSEPAHPPPVARPSKPDSVVVTDETSQQSNPWVMIGLVAAGVLAIATILTTALIMFL